MWIGEPPQPAVKLPAGQELQVMDLRSEGIHTLGHRFAGTVTINQIQYHLEFNEASVAYPNGKPKLET